MIIVVIGVVAVTTAVAIVVAVTLEAWLRLLLPHDILPPQEAVDTRPAPTNEFFAATRRCDSSLSFRI